MTGVAASGKTDRSDRWGVMTPELTSGAGRVVEYEGEMVKISEGSDVIHIPLEGKTACNYFPIPASAPTFTAEEAATRFRLCDDCAESYDPVTGLSSPYYREKILEELGVERRRENPAFDQEQLRAIFRKLTE